jgi:hypothetical protein
MPKTQAFLKFAALALLVQSSASAQRLSGPTAFERYKQLVSVSPDCKKRAAPDEIVVCANRDADKYRLPFVPTPDEGDPRGETRGEERIRLQNITTPCQNYNLFLSGCGMVGATVSTRIGGDGRPKLRKPAK